MSNTLNRWLPLLGLVACLVVAVVAVIAQAQAPSTDSPAAAVKDRPGVVYVDRSSLAATVEAVDMDKRTVTLRGPDGKTVTLKAPPEVRNFDQIKTGDAVLAEFLDAVAVFVRTSDTPPDAGETGRVEVAPRGEKPALAMADTVEVRARVEAIDHGTRTVTLRGPEGNVKSITVDPSVQRLDQVKVGDEVVIRHTEAVAITVRKPS